ncbi:hypothetical protein KR093_007953, partial [Drosophila rubida]
QNTTYLLYDMQFDANYFPIYLPEYNFTFTGLFYANNVKAFEIRVAGSFCDMHHDCS